eukprot:jgi/Hompol1/3698/HPOL_006692-RA
MYLTIHPPLSRLTTLVTDLTLKTLYPLTQRLLASSKSSANALQVALDTSQTLVMADPTNGDFLVSLGTAQMELYDAAPTQDNLSYLLDAQVSFNAAVAVTTGEESRVQIDAVKAQGWWKDRQNRLDKIGSRRASAAAATTGTKGKAAAAATATTSGKTAAKKPATGTTPAKAPTGSKPAAPASKGKAAETKP